MPTFQTVYMKWQRVYCSSLKLSHIQPFSWVSFFLPGSYSRRIMQWFTSCELIFNGASMAWWKMCFPFNLIWVPQSTGCSPLPGVSGNYRQAGQGELMQDWNHKQYLCIWSTSPCNSYAKLAMGFISQKEITVVEIQNRKSDLWASICSVLTGCVIANNINPSEPF